MLSFRHVTHLHDLVRTQEDFQQVLDLYEQLQSFQGYYALAEIYKNNESPNERIAGDYFLKAYEAYQNEQKSDVDQLAQEFRLKVRVDGVETVVEKDPADIKEVNALLEKAKTAHPEYLFQLACLYRRELDNFGNALKRLISVVKKEELVLWTKRCLQAAADSYHPHAAYLLARDYANHPLLEKSEHLDAAQRMKYCSIAADPTMHIRLNNPMSTVIFARPDVALANPAELMKPEATAIPLALKKMSGKIGGIHEQSANVIVGDILPAKHEAFKAQVLSASAGPSLTGEEMRRQRLARLTAAKPVVEAKVQLKV